ncbi:ribose 5-phosphate isomerase B [Candidatus Poriferisodalis sp.]|uniref:ribose 5-phosphate isomerase B n=1 Tax=Candidatus Poriferisodalis sp. TaxID=3101277 RepID=UPI003B024694
MAPRSSSTPGETVIALASDHAGWELKDRLAEHLRNGGYAIVDLGTSGPESVDYPDFGEAVGKTVASRTADLGVAVCGSGIGIAMAAGKVAGIRAATVHDETSARLAREHNDANVICLGARLLDDRGAVAALDAYLAAAFEGGRHQRRVDKIDALGRC